VGFLPGALAGGLVAVLLAGLADIFVAVAAGFFAGLAGVDAGAHGFCGVAATPVPTGLSKRDAAGRTGATAMAKASSEARRRDGLKRDAVIERS
jgi:hypothetical protein